MDAISSLVGASVQARAVVDAAAQHIAAADLPVSADGIASTAEVNRNIDVAEQMTTLMVAAGQHHATTAALRAALDMYQTSVEMLTRSV
jgi:hypothetical protein